MSRPGSGNKTSETKSFGATRSDRFFWGVYQTAPTGIAITDWLGVFQECNPAYCALLGYTEEELRSVDFASLVHPEDREANLAQIRRLQAGETSSFNIESRYIQKNGAPVWVHEFVSVMPGENGEPAHLITRVTSTTGRHHAEQMLRASEARLRVALEASDAGTWSWDARTNQTHWDERYGSMYGIPGETPRHETWVACIHPEDRPRVLARINEVRNTPGDDTWNVEFRAIRPDGIVLWMHALGRAARDAKGQLLSLSGINVDITERKRREANSAFSAEVNAVLSQLSTIDEIMQAFGPRISVFLKVSSVHFWDVDVGRNEARLRCIWAAPEAAALPASVRLADFLSDDLARATHEGKTAVVRDTETDARVDVMACRAIQVRSVVVVPFLQEGKWKYSLNVFDSSPRNWREDEVELIEELANVIFSRVERACAEEALRDSEERYRRLAEQVLDGIFVTDSKGRYVDANRSGCEMFGYTLEELRTLTVEDVIAPEELQRLPEQFRRLASLQVVRNDWLFKRKDASVFTGELVCRQFSDGRLQGVVRDITERKTAELAVQASEQQLQSYLDHAGDCIYVLESESGRILNANERAVQMLGYSRDEFLKLRAADIESAHPAAAIHAAHQQAIQEVVAVEGVHRRKDGSKFPVEIRLTSLAPAQPHLVLALVRDITERKWAEAALEDEARRKDEFLALLGHELRNPLAGISIGLQVLSGLGGPRRAAIEEMMGQQVTLMQRLLDDLLDLGRITYGHIELKKECIDLTEFLLEATASTQSVIANRRQELLPRLPSESVQFMADRIRLKQIATNLLSNASKYTKPGGRIELSGAREGSEVVLHCKDNGQGVLPEDQKRIFEPFTRGSKTQKSHGEASLGIGLALAKQLTELHGGSISVVSAGADMGSDFIVRLPLVTPPSDKPVTAEPAHAIPSHRGCSIVIVEDNTEIAGVMAIALGQAGHSARMFPDGASAIAGVATLKPDAVLLDIGLPDMDGYELAVELKKLPNMRHALFIAISGFKPREQAGQAAGNFDHYLTKPVDISALLALIDTHSPKKQVKPKKTERLRVLLVEDHANLAAATATLLRGEGLEVRTALTGREALEMATNFRPQLILCDLNLPDMDGLETIRALRSNPSTQKTHAVIVTAMSETEIRAYNSKAGELGVDAFMSKPIKVEAVRTLASKLKP